ncbi:MAG TPA: 2-C-methyl-D-erythritol 4-phosphate cytidylyltransferase [Candidatus Ornithospirochaeta avicola]|uniref:2-C-methyl-D-erythritol 4-phosphate cytidylyltransferase n=1 Tax=Candidatus Ornithospirochaeta avicola TaxID=2840896 RepID=A0A9D1TNA7_9SPIO|nr:2-C-methyl-D-erythritol 4-phosphate cytidylyltransferase [Candidatus Ornithospirochaeta avicola]
MSIPPFAVIITAAGKSERFNSSSSFNAKKEFLKIDGHTVLYRATEPFFEIPGLAAVVITCPEGMMEETYLALEDLGEVNSLPFLIIEGGKTRFLSIKNALSRLSSLDLPISYVAIHDGARPFVTPDMIIRALANASVAGGAVPALRITDSVKRLSDDNIICENVDRKQLIRVQTPQVFRFDEILSAYEKYESTDASDDAEVFVSAGYRCTVIKGDESNKKITYSSDIPDAEKQSAEYALFLEEAKKSRDASRRMRELLYGIKEERK